MNGQQRCDTHTYAMEYCTAIKKNEVLSWIHLEGIMLNKISGTEKRQVSYDFMSMWNPENKTNKIK